MDPFQLNNTLTLKVSFSLHSFQINACTVFSHRIPRYSHFQLHLCLKNEDMLNISHQYSVTRCIPYECVVLPRERVQTQGLGVLIF